MTESDSRSAGVIVGAYAASPSHSIWNPDVERKFFEGLAALPLVRGLELPWTSGLHPHNDAWLLANLPPRFDVVITSIPGTMTRLGRDANFGLASLEPEGRAAAVAEVLRMWDGVRRLNDRQGRSSVLAVELHSAPAAHRGSADMFAASLAELVDEDWDGARLVVEHCDATIPDQRAEKGFLALDDELSVLDRLGGAVGLSINWGRSLVELRDPELVLQHIIAGTRSGHLRGVMFSGVSSVAGDYGPAWADAHLPAVPTSDFPQGEPSSLLTERRIVESLHSAGNLDWFGFKFGWRPADAPVENRIAMIGQAARMIDTAAATPYTRSRAQASTPQASSTHAAGTPAETDGA